jgi:hypothetical protein
MSLQGLDKFIQGDDRFDTPENLSCGCVGECDSRSHDTHPDGICKPAGPGRDDEMERVAKTILRLANSIPSPTTKLAIERAGVELARLVIGEEAE